jgi:putative transposase
MRTAPRAIEKAVQFQPETVSSFSQNRCPVWPEYAYPPEIRKAIYTTNAVESLNSVIRAATKRRKVFPTDDSARKVVYLAIEQASRKWTMPIQNWKMALNRFVLEFGERVTVHHP